MRGVEFFAIPKQRVGDDITYFRVKCYTSLSKRVSDPEFAQVMDSLLYFSYDYQTKEAHIIHTNVRSKFEMPNPADQIAFLLKDHMSGEQFKAWRSET